MGCEKSKPSTAKAVETDSKDSNTNLPSQNTNTVSKDRIQNDFGSKRILSIYFNNTKQDLGMYPGTSSDDILNTIRLVYKFEKSQELLFLDEDGIPIVLSSSLPSGTKLYMKKNYTETENTISRMNETKKIEKSDDSLKKISWTWKQPGNSSHKLKNQKLTVYQPVNETISYCYGDLVITEGKIYYTLVIDPIMCCVYAGIEESGRNFAHESSDYLTKLNFWSYFEEEKSARKAIEAGFLVDMDSRTLQVTNHTKKLVVITSKFDSKWKEVSPLVYFKHEVSMTISNQSLAIPDWI